jgi:Mce-associated membrane protein
MDSAGTGAVETQRGRRLLRWRRGKNAAADPDSSGIAVGGSATADEPARKMPTGKAGRAQQPVSTSAAEGESEAPAPEEVAEPDARPPEAVDADTAEAGSEPGSEPGPEPVFVAHRPPGKRLLTTAAAASVVFVGASAFAGAMLQPYLADRASVDIKLGIARTATNAITTLWSYTPEDMATLPDRSDRYLAGDFATEYRRYIDAIVPTNEQAKVTNTTEVMGAAVESFTPTEATALVYTNSVSTSPVSKNIPSLRYLSYRLTMERDGADWLITGMNAVTQLDLSPQL